MKEASIPKTVWAEYVRSIFLRYVEEHPDVDLQTFYPAYFQRELRISDSYMYIQRLIRQGYLEKKEDVGMALTEQGREAICEEHTRFFDLASPYISYGDYLAEKEALQDQEPFHIVMLSLMLKKSREYRQMDNYMAVKSVQLDAAVLYEQAGITDRAMYHYLVSLYYDVSGLEYYAKLVKYAQGKKVAAAKIFEGLGIRPQVQKGICRLKDVYSPDMVDEVFEREQISMNMCSKKNFRLLVEELRGGKYDYVVWRARFEAAYQEIVKSITAQYREEK